MQTKIDGAGGITVASHKRMRTLKCHNVWSLIEVSADVLAVNSGNSIILWKIESNQTIAKLNGHAEPVRGMQLLKKGGRHVLLSAGEDKTMRVWDGSKKVLAIHTAHTKRITSIIVLGSKVISASDDGEIFIYNVIYG